MVLTDWPEMTDRPRSACKTFPSHVPYCSITGLIEAELGPHLRDLRRRSLASENDRGGIAGNELEQQEREGDDHPQQHETDRDSLNRVLDHDAGLHDRDRIKNPAASCRSAAPTG